MSITVSLPSGPYLQLIRVKNSLGGIETFSSYAECPLATFHTLGRQHWPSKEVSAVCE